MEQDYDGEAGHADFSETQDFTEMLDRYYSEDTGYKDQLSRDQLIKRYMRQMELY
jgi:hypothetical protein